MNNIRTSLLLLITGCGLPLSTSATLVDYQNVVTSNPGLVAYYTFDSGTANDSKSTFNGTAQGTVAFDQGIGGGSDKAAVFNGSSQINLGAVDAFDFASGTGTIEAWIRADWTASPGYNPAIFADRDGGPVNWSIHMNSGKDAVGLWNGSTYEPNSIPGGAGTNWHHFAAVFDVDPSTGTPSFTEYWDGNPIGSSGQGLGAAPEAPPTQLGSSSVSGAEQWRGALDEVAFYSTALSAETVKAHYTAFLVGEKPSILKQPLGGTFLSGVTLELAVSAKGAQLSYQWAKDGAPLSGQTNATLSLANLDAAKTGSYTVSVSNPAGQVTSSPAQIVLGTLSPKVERYQSTVRAESTLVSYYTFDAANPKDIKGSNDGTVHGSVQFGPGLGGTADKALVMDGTGHVNLGQVSAFDFTAATGTVEAWVRSDWTTGVGYNPTIFSDRDGGPVNWSVHMNDAKDAAGLWNGSSYEPQATPGTGTSWHHLATVFDTDPGTGEPRFTLYWDGQPAGSTAQGLGTSPESPTELGSASPGGQELWVGALDEVAFYSSALTAETIQQHYAAFIAGTPPVITVQPLGGTYFNGDALTLTVGVQGTGLTYQWLKDSQPIAGQTNASLVLPALGSSDTGSYTVRVSNPDGSVESNPAIVAVGVPDLTKYQAAVRSESSLISYYTFDQGDATDSKSGHNGTAVDSVAYGTGVASGTDKALLLEGLGHVDLGQVDAFDFTSGKGSVEAWIRADWTNGPGYNPAIFADRDGAPVNWSIHMNSGKDAAGLWNGSAYSPLPITRTGTTWHHLAVVFDRDAASGASSFTLYWDGARAGTTTQGLGTAPESPTELGASFSLGAEYWIGALDEVAFYSTALTADAVQRHYLALLGGAPASAPKLGVTRNGTQLTLTWPSDVTGYVLEFAGELGGAAWTAVPNVTGNTATVNIGSAQGFYRLRKP